MSKTTKKKGLPKSVQEAIDRTGDDGPQPETQSLEAFIFEQHGEGVAVQSQEGMPSIEWLMEQFKTKSAVIRYLINQGHTINQIHKHTGWRYQMCRNIATSPLKRGPNEDWRKPLLEGSNIPDSKDFKPPED
jgi:hypothetical protein